MKWEINRIIQFIINCFFSNIAGFTSCNYENLCFCRSVYWKCMLPDLLQKLSLEINNVLIIWLSMIICENNFIRIEFTSGSCYKKFQTKSVPKNHYLLLHRHARIRSISLLLTSFLILYTFQLKNNKNIHRERKILELSIEMTTSLLSR